MKRRTRLFQTELLEARTHLSVPAGKMRMEDLDRGVIAMNRGSGSVYVGWRLLGTEPTNLGFNVYRSAGGAAPVKRNSTVITTSTNFNDTGVNTSVSNRYFVRPVINGVEQADSESFVMPANEPIRQFLNVPLSIPAGGTTPDAVAYTYNANDASTADLDGDGQYEIILKWDPTNSKDNSQSGYTGNVYVDAYKLDGTMMWRIDLGVNIRAGAHYTQFIAYDLDSDGRAEVAMKTAPGTIDGAGNPVLMGSDSATADYRNASGYILTGPEYLTVFNGLTGAARKTVAFEPARGAVTQWGDSYGNRVDRFTAAIAYVDGERPSLIMGRGYYGPQSSSGQARNEIAAYDFRNDNLTLRWHFKAGYNINGNINGTYVGQGPHGMSVADVDADGKDEIVYGAAVIDDNGAGLYSTGLGHGDAFHVSDLDPSRPGLEVFMVHESPGSYQSNGRNAGGEFRDARTGELIWQIPATNDVGRGVSGDIDPNSPGAESWALTNDPDTTVTRKIWAANGTALYDMPSNMHVNFLIWWDGDLTRETLDGTTISEWNNPGRSNFDLDPATSGTQGYVPGGSGNNGTKNTPNLTADLFGDWREEMVVRRTDNTALMIYTTTITASNRLYTLMHDPQYRAAVAWQNGAYNQPPHPGFFLGANMPPAPTPDILLALAPVTNLQVTSTNTPTVTLTWTPSAGATLYDVLRSTSANGTYTEIATGLTAATYIDSAVTGNVTYYYKVVARSSVGASNATAAVSVFVPLVPPAVLSTSFQDEVAPISFTYTFSKNVSASLAGNDLIVQRTDGLVVSATLASYNTTTQRAVFTVSAPLPKGIYTVVLNASSITDVSGQTLTGVVPIAIYSLPGDVSRNRSVDFDDLLIVAANYNTTSKSFSQGNIDYDPAGNVNFDDLLILAANYNMSLFAGTESLVAPPVVVPPEDDEPVPDDNAPLSVL